MSVMSPIVAGRPRGAKRNRQGRTRLRPFVGFVIGFVPFFEGGTNGFSSRSFFGWAVGRTKGGVSPLISKRKRDGRDGSRRPYFARVFTRVIVSCRLARVMPTYMRRRSSSTVSSC